MNDGVLKIQLETALKEYQFIRDEMLQRQSQRMNMTYILSFVIVTLWAGATQTTTPWLVGVLFGVTPLFSFFILYQVYESYRLHAIQADYSLQIEDKVNKLLQDAGAKAKDWLFWQHYFNSEVKKNQVKRLVRKKTYLAIMWISIAISLLGIFLELILPLETFKAVLSLLQNNGFNIFLFLTIVYLFIGVIFTRYYHRL